MSVLSFYAVHGSIQTTQAKWGHEDAEADRFKRFLRGIPPRSNGDYAFILHMIDTTLPRGKVGVIVPHGVLFRGSAEGRIQQL